MNPCRALLFVFLSYMFTFATPLLAQQCSNLSLDMINDHERLYEYALISDAAYGTHPTNFCDVSATGNRIEMPAVQEHKLLPSDVDSKWKHEFLERWQAGIPRPDAMGRYVGDNDVTYITCTYDFPMPQFALTWSEFRQPQEGEEAPLAISVLFGVQVVIPRSMLPENPLTHEEIGIVRLTRDPSPTGESEDLVAIQGTDFTRIPQVVASMQHLLSTSCVYEMAAIVVAVVGAPNTVSQVSVIGHSLGGGAVQYIVHDHTRNPWRNPMNGSRSNVTFDAYSFNSVGLDSSSANAANLPYLTSYIVDGEIVSWMGNEIGQAQIGTVIRYIPPDDWPVVGTLTIVGNVIQGELPEPVRRHRLPAIQHGICECINGRGSILAH